jgi:phosphatidylglycerol---prolipoprotein diacylglyceryl transferase
MTPIAPDLHETYGVLMVASVALLLLSPTTRQFTRPEDRARYYTMQAITALGAAAGAKLGVLFGDALWPLRAFGDWSALLASGRSIAGALLFGFLAVEVAKPILRYDIPPNDRFAVMLPFSIAIGRLGCLVAGCCRGAPWDGPFAVVYSDGIPRHPAQLYESLFQLLAGWALLVLWRRGILFGRLFAVYLASYGVFRFATEFIRDTEKPFAGLSAYQWMSVAMIVAGATALYVRSRAQPESWRRWHTQGEAA